MEHSSWRNSFSSGPWNGAQDFGPYDRCVSRGLLASMFPSVAYPLKQDFEYGLLEYACHEGNHYAMSNMLSGARAAERAAAEKK